MTAQNYFFALALRSRVVDDVELLALLEAEVILGAGLVLVEGDEQRHSSTCGRNAAAAQHLRRKPVLPFGPL